MNLLIMHHLGLRRDYDTIYGVSSKKTDFPSAGAIVKIDVREAVRQFSFGGISRQRKR